MELSDRRVDADVGEEEIGERVAAIDVAKDCGMVCVRMPHRTQSGKRDTSVWSVAARTNSIIALANQLAEQGVQRVVLESTSEDWRPFYYLLDARGLTVWLVNAREVKHVPGRPKTDKLDASAAWCGPCSSRRWRSAGCVTTGCAST